MADNPVFPTEYSEQQFLRSHIAKSHYIAKMHLKKKRDPNYWRDRLATNFGWRKVKFGYCSKCLEKSGSTVQLWLGTEHECCSCYLAMKIKQSTLVHDENSYRKFKRMYLSLIKVTS